MNNFIEVNGPANILAILSLRNMDVIDQQECDIQIKKEVEKLIKYMQAFGRATLMKEKAPLWHEME